VISQGLSPTAGWNDRNNRAARIWAVWCSIRLTVCRGDSTGQRAVSFPGLPIRQSGCAWQVT